MLSHEHFLFNIGIIVLILFGFEDMLDKFLNFSKVGSNPLSLFCFILLLFHFFVEIELIEGCISPSPSSSEVLFPLSGKSIVLFSSSRS